MENIVIIGGGLAGLSAALHLIEHGIPSTILEAGQYPAHKLCGEFLSAECRPFLRKWGIKPKVNIDNISFHAGLKSYSFALPQPATAISHWQLDAYLANLAKERGVQLKTGIKVNEIERAEKYKLKLSTGEILLADKLVVATGRLASLSSSINQYPYIGFSAHFRGHITPETLKFFSFPGAYLGISALSDDEVNIACIATRDAFQSFSGPEPFMHALMERSPELKKTIDSMHKCFPEWLHSPIPAFGFKEIPDWPNAYFIGDAAYVLPPVIGEGLSTAIQIGKLVAEHLCMETKSKFQDELQAHIAPSLIWGKRLNNILLRPRFCTLTMELCKLFPSISEAIYRKTRVQV